MKKVGACISCGNAIYLDTKVKGVSVHPPVMHSCMCPARHQSLNASGLGRHQGLSHKQKKMGSTPITGTLVGYPASAFEGAPLYKPYYPLQWIDLTKDDS